MCEILSYHWWLFTGKKWNKTHVDVFMHDYFIDVFIPPVCMFFMHIQYIKLSTATTEMEDIIANIYFATIEF